MQTGNSMSRQLTRNTCQFVKRVSDRCRERLTITIWIFKRFYSLYNQLFEKVPQVGEIFKPLHAITENRMLPLNIFAIKEPTSLFQIVIRYLLFWQQYLRSCISRIQTFAIAVLVTTPASEPIRLIVFLSEYISFSLDFCD